MATLSRDDLTDEFKEIIWDNEEVCRNCYRQRAAVYERNYYNNKGESWPVRQSISEIVLTEHYPTTALGAYRDRPTRGSTDCCECGAVSRTTYDRPTEKHRALALLIRAIRWYEDASYTVDTASAAARTLGGLRDPDNQHVQDLVIDQALDNSIQTAPQNNQ